MVLCINRNIVECKEESREIHSLQKMCINRNIVECKEIHETVEGSPGTVLIETLWNVKLSL